MTDVTEIVGGVLENLKKDAQPPTLSEALLADADCLKIVDHATAEAAAKLDASIREFQKKIEEEANPGIQLAHGLHKHLVGQRKAAIEPLEEARRVIKKKYELWQVAEETKRKRLAAAEAEAVAKRAKEEEQENVEALRSAGLTKVEATREAKALTRLQVEAAQAEAQNVGSPKVAGFKTIKKWTGEVQDMRQLLQAILDERAPLNFIAIDTEAIRNYAVATKGSAPVPGVRFYQKPITAGSGR